MEVYHTAEGALILILSDVILILSFCHGLNKWARVFAVWSTLATIAALVGGLLFVFSGFSDNGSSARMGGSFLSVYAGHFLMLFFLR